MAVKIKLSIIIVNFNTYTFLNDCIQSIKKSGYENTSLEIIVIDNNSSDKSVHLIQKNHPNIHLISNDRNLGFAAANNIGIQKSHGEYILLLNPDTILSSNTLSIMTTYLDNHQDTGVATCRVELPDGRIDDGCHRGFPTPWNAFCHFIGLGKLFPSSQLFNGYHLGYKKIDKVHEIDSCVGAFMMIRKVAGKDIGWFDEDYFWYGEDIDFCFRVKKSGWKVMFVPNTKISHHKGVSSGIKKHSRHVSTASKKTKIQAMKARFDVMRIFYKKHYQSIYPKWLTYLVLWGIRMLKAIHS